VTEPGPVWIAVLLAIPAAVAVVASARVDVERLRTVALAAAGLLLAAGSVPFAARARAALTIEAPPSTVLQFHTLGTVLVPLVALLWCLAVGLAPRSTLDRDGIRRTAIATLVHMALFLTRSPTAIVVLWSLSVIVLLRGLATGGMRRATRIAAVFLGGSTLLLAIGVLGLARFPTGTPGANAAALCVALAVMVREGLVPLHIWIPESLEHGRLGPVVLFCAPQVGAYVAVVLLLPAAPAGLLTVIGKLALVTAVYGAVSAVAQRDARRAFGYVFISQSALVMAGVECLNEAGLTGGLCLWLSSGVAFAALARCLAVLEARRGRLALDRFNGGYERMPVLASSFLLIALASIGFPGTFGFLGHEFLVQGTVARYAHTGFLVVAASGFGAVALLRAYFSLFCGRSDRGIHLGLRPREAFLFGLVAALLVGAGLAPRPLLSTLHTAATRALDLRTASPDRGPSPDGALRLSVGDGPCNMCRPLASSLVSESLRE